MHEKTSEFLEAVGASKCMNDASSETCAEALLDEIEELVAEAMTLRRSYRHALRGEEDDELRGRLGGYESKLGAVDRDAGKLLQALETFRTTVSHMKRADRRLRLWVEDHEFVGDSDRNDPGPPE